MAASRGLPRSDVLVQRVRALGRQPPKPRAEILAPRALQKVRVRDAHEVGWPPAEVFRDRMCLCSVFALLGGNRQSRALRFSLPVRSRKSAFGMHMRLDGRQKRSSEIGCACAACSRSWAATAKAAR